MICNNTNIPTVENIISGCNNGCEPKDINIVCRKMIIPSGQEILCVQGDNNSTIRNFVIPNSTESGISLVDKVFNIVLENSNKEYIKIKVDKNNIINLDSYIKIKWNILEVATQYSGNLKVAIEAIGENFKWQTYTGIFYINNSVINPNVNMSFPENNSNQNDCNKNTHVLLYSKNEENTCENICEPKDINIVCRKMIILSGQNIIGIQGDINSNIRNFILPIETESGINLKDKNFNILEQNSDGTQWRMPLSEDNIDISDTYIKLKWDIGKNETAVSGTLKVAIEATEDNFKWQSYIGEFYVYPSIQNIKKKINPEIVLQKKTVFPTTTIQNVFPDEGYDGLSEVIINPILLKDIEITENGVYEIPIGFNGFGKIIVNVQCGSGGLTDEQVEALLNMKIYAGDDLIIEYDKDILDIDFELDNGDFIIINNMEYVYFDKNNKDELEVEYGTR